MQDNLRSFLAQIGVSITVHNSHEVIDFDEVSSTVRHLMKIYEMALKDPDLARAAYGLFVGGVSMALNVNLRTAVLLVEHALALRGLRHA